MQDITRKRLMGVVYRLAVTTVGLGVAVLLFKHAAVSGFGALLLAAVLLTLCNTFIKPILTLISLPFVVLTLGLFYFVINGLVILLVAWLSSGFYVDGLWTAIGMSIVVSLINYFFDRFYFPDKRLYIFRR